MPYFTNRGIIPIPLPVGGSTATWDLTSRPGVPLAFSGGDLTATHTGGADGIATGTSSASSGKYYFEVTIGAISGPGNNTTGIAATSITNFVTYLGSSTVSVGMAGDGGIYGASGTGSSYGAGDVVGVAIDFTADLIWWRVNAGVWNAGGGANPASGTGGIDISSLDAGPYVPAASQHTSGDNITANFGATTFANAAPSGFGNFP